MSIRVAPSVLSADFANMARDIKMVESHGADLLHCDVMDGVFVPNISFGPKMVEDINKVTDLELDVHLMIVKPENYIEQFAQAGADYLTIHIETAENPTATLERIRKLGVKSGIVINPHTDVKIVDSVLDYCDMVLLMSVQPGFGGQKFMPHVLEKLEYVKNRIVKSGENIHLEIDGGITEENVDSVISAGADIIVAGSTVFNSSDKTQTIKRLRGQK